MPEQAKPKVFVVHGHDLKVRDNVATYLKQLGITPIVLQEGTNQGDTIVEKLERYGEDVTYAIVIMSPDDQGADSEEVTRAIRVVSGEATKLNSEMKTVNSANATAAVKGANIANMVPKLAGSMREQYYTLLKPLSARARQNVILELGYFMGKLGRKRVCILVLSPTPRNVSPETNATLFKLSNLVTWDFPSDTQGVAFVDYNNGWEDYLRQELQAAGVI